MSVPARKADIVVYGTSRYTGRIIMERLAVLKLSGMEKQPVHPISAH